MSLRSFYLRKSYWIKDFFGGCKMWSQYKEVMYIADNQNLAGGVKLEDNDCLHSSLLHQRMCRFISHTKGVN